MITAPRRSASRATLASAALLALTLGAQAADPIKVGVTITQSPPGSVVMGVQVKDGLDIVAKMINDAGGIDGRPIQLIVEDTQGLPEKARAAVEKLITRDKVVAITGDHQSSSALAGLEVAHRYNIPYVNTNAWSDVVREKGYAEVFNPGNYNSRVGASAAATMKALGAKRVVSFAENTDYGIGLAKAIGESLKKVAPDIQYKYETLDRASKDFLPAILPLRANPPDAIINIMLPPAAYIMMNQVYEQGVAPSAKTWIYDGSGLADYPDFWQNVKEAGKGMLVFGLYHPKMKQPPLGKTVGDLYTAKTKNEPNRLLFQAADSLFIIADAIKRAKSTEPAAMIKALEETKFTGTRGEITFSKEKGYTYNQWIEVPYVTFQLTEVNQKVENSALVEQPGQPLDPAKLWKPAK
ncbi:MAG TPA: ABC transporter substrate-binding protein [Xanthobacteraceae bacterium]|nr:ABC transporter substrate-binding protein [Xanthobacteraceae bacterium]